MSSFFQATLISTYLLLTSTLSFAAFTTSKPISTLKAQDDGIRIKLKDFVNTDASINCDINDFLLPNTDDNYNGKSSLLLAAFMSGKPVKFSYYGCTGVFIKLGSVLLEGQN